MQGHARTRLAGWSGAVLVAAAVLVPAPADAVPRTVDHQRCAPVEATGSGQDLGGGRTEATLSVAGVPVATSAATFTIGAVNGTVASFTGPIVLTPVLGPGTLTAQVAGTFDLSSGAFRATSTSLSGTGPLKKVTGALTFAGVEDLGNGSFTETVTGQLCR
jgi:hypothetical protein